MKKDRYLILELANSHNGSVNQIFSLLNKLDNFKNQNIGLKFQIISKDFLSLKNFKWYPVYQKLYFSRPIWKKIINKALTKEANIWIDIFVISMSPCK